ncbi:MAG: MFS transporter, partial [Myxococcota bacterium]
LVAKWFSARRGRALGIAAVGASLGGFVFPPLVAALLARFGWRGALLGMGVFVVLCAIPIGLFVRSRPEEVGEVPDGIQAAASGGEPRALRTGPADGSVGVSLEAREAPAFGTRELLRSRNLWVITASLGLAWCSVGVLLAHLIPYAMDRGFSAKTAAFLMSAYAGAGVAGRLAFGALADRFDKRAVIASAVGLLGLGWSGLIASPSFSMLLAACLAMGVGVGGLMPLWGALTGACFGRAAFGRAMGLMNPLMFPFNLAGAPMAAWLYDRTGDYTMAFTGFLATLVASIAIACLLRVPAVEPGSPLPAGSEASGAA